MAETDDVFEIAEGVFCDVIEMVGLIEDHKVKVMTKK